MSTHPLLARVCAIAPTDLLDLLRVRDYDDLLDADDLGALETRIEADELVCLDDIVATLLGPELGTAMAVASPHARRDLEKYQEGRGRRYRYGGRLQRSALGYATRAGVKPSPFSHFTFLACPTAGERSDRYQESPTRRLIDVLESTGLSRDGELPDHSTATIPNPTLRRIDGRLLGWRADYVIDDGFAWRADQVIDATGWESEETSEHPDAKPLATIDDPLMLLDGARVLVLGEGPIGTTERAPSEASPPPDPPGGAPVVHYAVGGTKPASGAYHLVTEGRALPDLPSSRTDAEVRAWLEDRVRISSFYDEIVAFALSQFGAGGRVDLAEFLIRCLEHFDEKTPSYAMRRPTPVERKTTALVPPMAAVYWQRCPEVGDDTIVINNSTGVGLGATFRWGGAFARHGAELVASIGAEVGVGIVPFTFGDEWNGIQDCDGQAFTWPSGRFDRPSDLPLDQFTVDVDTTGLRVRRNGTVVVPLYVGAQPDHLLGGGARIFGLLGHPWSFDYVRPSHPGGRWSRSTFDETVMLQRAGAVLGIEAIEEHARLPLADSMRRLDAWRTSVDLPRSVFWRELEAHKSLRAATRKPAFLDFSSPHLVASFLQTATTDVRIEEAAPDPRVASGETEEFVSLIVLPADPERHCDPDPCNTEGALR